MADNKSIMNFFFFKHKKYWQHKEFITSVILGTVFLFFSIVANFYAGIYATKNASGPVTDIILSNIRVYNMEDFFVYGPFVLWIVVTALCLYDPKNPLLFSKVLPCLFLFIPSL
jgi:hypothetical protein